MDRFKPLAASGPGQGTGNIPFAPGAISGNFGGPPAPTARMVAPMHAPMRPGPGNPGHPTGPGGALSPPGGPPPGGPPPGGPPSMPPPTAGMGGLGDPTALFQMVKAYADALQGYVQSSSGRPFPWS